ncbi:MAG: hypothetical protein ACREPP_09185, partial [Rhodanobacteraceae bacterium]
MHGTGCSCHASDLRRAKRERIERERLAGDAELRRIEQEGAIVYGEFADQFAAARIAITAQVKRNRFDRVGQVGREVTRIEGRCFQRYGPG